VLLEQWLRFLAGVGNREEVAVMGCLSRSGEEPMWQIIRASVTGMHAQQLGWVAPALMWVPDGQTCNLSDVCVCARQLQTSSR
jgi:hypothetical protein